jgi:PAS domain S-box-containing protein
MPALPYLSALALMAGVTAALLPVHELVAGMPGAIALPQIIVVVVIGTHWGKGPAILAAVFGILAIDFFFLPPYFAFSRPSVGEDVVLFTHFVASFAVAHICANAKRRTELAEARKEELGRLYGKLQRESSERQRAEETLQESELQYRVLLESTPDAMVIVDRERRIRLMNSQVETLFGYERSDLLGKPVEILIPEALRERHVEHCRDYMVNPRTRRTGHANVELLGRRKDGSEFPADISLSPSHRGDEFLVIAAVRDISEHKRAQEKLRRTTAELQRVITSVSDCVWSAETDEHGQWCCRYCSPVVEKITGHPREFYYGHPERWASAVHPDDKERVREAIERIRKGQSPYEENEYRIVMPDETLRWVRDSMTATSLGDTRVRIDGVIGDITGLKQAEAERQARLAAEATSRAKSEFLANMSHELRSPLNIILGFARLAARYPDLAEEPLDDLQHVIRGGEYLQTLINQVLDLSKLEAGRTSLNEADFDLAFLLQDLQDLFTPIATSKGLRLNFEPDPDVPRHVRADALKLRQVLINLIDNSLKFTRGGSVDVTVEADAPTFSPADRSDGGPTPGCRLRFTVSDSGPGIAPDELKELFGAFVQAEAGRRAKQGTGLGLAISRGFVELMGGQIAVSSRLGTGTTVRFDLPVRVAPALAPLGDKPMRHIVGLAAGQPHYRLLVVDDQPEARQLLVRLLAPLGFELKEAANGMEALDQWRRWRPQLIWMDARMQGMDGQETTRRIRDAEAKDPGRHTVIIALSANGLDEERSRASSAAYDDMLRKPFRETELWEILEKHLGARFVYQEDDLLPMPLFDAKALAQLPDALRQPLAFALRRLDSAAVDQAIDGVAGVDARLASSLAAFAREFQYDQILAVLENSAEGRRDGEARDRHPKDGLASRPE